MRPKLKSRAGSGEQLFAFLSACILLLGGATLIREDIVTIVVTCSVFVVAGITRRRRPYFYLETFVRGNSLKRLAQKSRGESSHEVSMVTREESISEPDCSMSDDRRDGDLTRESLLDAAVERIVRGIQRDQEVGK